MSQIQTLKYTQADPTLSQVLKWTMMSTHEFRAILTFNFARQGGQGRSDKLRAYGWIQPVDKKKKKMSGIGRVCLFVCVMHC